MFENLLKFWKGKDFLNQVLEEFKSMLDDGQTMFDAVCKKLIDNQEDPNLKENIYSLDKKINELQRDIRKRVVEHLSMRPSVDVSTCLLLMSVTKDAERLGDYAKNLFEVSNIQTNNFNSSKYQELFGSIHEEISELFKETKKAFIESDEDKAAHTWDHKRKITKRCDEIIKKLAQSDITVNDAVCLTLTARYYKRLTAHLTNIATSVIVPLTDLDYFDENRERS